MKTPVGCCQNSPLLSNLFLPTHQVLDLGRLKEYDEPYILLQEQESLFYKMVQQLGKAEALSILETAKQVRHVSFSTPPPSIFSSTKCCN